MDGRTPRRKVPFVRSSVNSVYSNVLVINLGRSKMSGNWGWWVKGSGWCRFWGGLDGVFPCGGVGFV